MGVDVGVVDAVIDEDLLAVFDGDRDGVPDNVPVPDEDLLAVFVGDRDGVPLPVEVIDGVLDILAVGELLNDPPVHAAADVLPAGLVPTQAAGDVLPKTQ